MKSPSRSKSGSANAVNGKFTPASATKKPRKKALPKADLNKIAARIGSDQEEMANGSRNELTALTSSAIGRGVTMRPSGKWQAQLYFAGQSRYIGVFESREKATLAYEIAREILKGGNTPSTPGEAAEKAVEAARKAAFEGVLRDARPDGSPPTTASRVLPQTMMHTTPAATTTPSTKTPSTTGSSTHSDGRSSMRALKAAEILKAIGKSIAASSEEDEMESEYVGGEVLNHSSSSTIDEGQGDRQKQQTRMPALVDRRSYGEELKVAEWELMDYREKNGWKGRDMVHDENAPVRIHQYFVKYGNGIGDLERGGEGTALTGIVHFSPKAESHRGVCHGGSMTAVMDDVVGWVAFLASGTCQPWSGYTVQINTSLRKAIPVDSWLLVSGTITKVEGGKSRSMAKFSIRRMQILCTLKLKAWLF
ncbi:Thioesterase superfamily [Fragilaria crotonensis]|nr:Thioesterase superfamily [Fragilaria crotonensis]